MKNHFIMIFIFIITVKGLCQSNVNPDISVIGTFNTSTDLTKDSPDKGKINFEMPDMELFVESYLNPYARGTGNI